MSDKHIRYWFDTEFMEDGKTIDLLSIGIVCEDGRELYLENLSADLSKAHPWVREHVLPSLDPLKHGVAYEEIGPKVLAFCTGHPEFWAYYGAYDWVAMCQLFGRMVDLPAHWPMWCRDVKQLCMDHGNPTLPKQTGIEHNALADAIWTKLIWELLQARRDPQAEGSASPRSWADGHD